jgi:hypothetical protein
MSSDIITAQLEGDQWVLGYWNNNSIDHSVVFFDFRNAKLEIIHKPDIKFFIRGCASNVCSINGESLIWTNGMQIMGSDGNLIADTIAYDGDGLYWIGFAPPGEIPLGFPELDNAIILPIPMLKDEYSIIYHYNEEHPRFIYATTQYLEARVKINQSGDFELIYKDFPIGPRTEWYNGTISSVRHANGRDWWLMYFVGYSPDYYVHLLDSTGIHFDHIGKLDVPIQEGLGQSTFSSQGNYFARMDAISKDSGEYISLFEFNRCAGDLNRLHTFLAPSGTHTGVAFSPSEQFFYANSNFELWQWDLKSENIEASQILVDTFDGFIEPGWLVTRFGPMKLAPDGRIYMNPTAGSSKYLHVIERPDLKAPECKFLQHAIELNIWNGRTAPNIPNYRLGPLDGSLCDTLGLNNLPKSRWRYEPDQPQDPLLIRFTDLAFFNPQTWHWDFGDGGTSDTPSPLHTFEPGLYHVCQTVSNQYATDSTCQWVEILPTGIQEELDRMLSDISVIPNPFQNFIVIQSRRGNFRSVHLQLYDIHGRLVFNQHATTIPSKIYFPDYPPGMYLISLTQDDGVKVSFKLIKQ